MNSLCICCTFLTRFVFVLVFIREGLRALVSSSQRREAAGMERSQKCLICTPLIASTVNEMLFQLQLAKDSGADVAELRVDHISDFNAESDLPALLKDRPLPVIVTPR